MVSAAQRFTRHNPCPTCGGWQSRRSGRCFGYITDDLIYCSQIPSPSRSEANLGAYIHRMTGQCLCGEDHPSPRDLGDPIYLEVLRNHHTTAITGGFGTFQDGVSKSRDVEVVYGAQAKVISLVRAQPFGTLAEIAEAAGVSLRSVKRLKGLIKKRGGRYVVATSVLQDLPIDGLTPSAAKVLCELLWRYCTFKAIYGSIDDLVRLNLDPATVRAALRLLSERGVSCSRTKGGRLTFTLDASLTAGLTKGRRLEPKPKERYVCRPFRQPYPTNGTAPEREEWRVGKAAWVAREDAKSTVIYRQKRRDAAMRRIKDPELRRLLEEAI